ELAPKRRPKRFEGSLAFRFAPAGGCFPGIDGLNEGDRKPLGDTPTDPAVRAGQVLEFRWLRHATQIVSKPGTTARNPPGTATGTQRHRAATRFEGAPRRDGARRTRGHHRRRRREK